MPHIDNDIKLDFKDVLLRPKRSTLKSRIEVTLERLARVSQSYPVIVFIHSFLNGCYRPRYVICAFVNTITLREKVGSPTGFTARHRGSNLCAVFQVDLNRSFKFRNSRASFDGVPIIAANMDTVGTFEMAQVLAKVCPFSTRCVVLPGHGRWCHCYRCVEPRALPFLSSEFSVHGHPQALFCRAVEGILLQQPQHR